MYVVLICDFNGPYLGPCLELGIWYPVNIESLFSWVFNAEVQNTTGKKEKQAIIERLRWQAANSTYSCQDLQIYKYVIRKQKSTHDAFIVSSNIISPHSLAKK